MSKELTNKTWVVLLGSGYKTYISAEQSVLFQQEKNMVVLKDGRVIKSWIAVLPANEVERDDKVKRGEWQCQEGYWHEKNQQCGHKYIR